MLQPLLNEKLWLKLKTEDEVPNARVPRMYDDKLRAPLEPITKSHPKYGVGGEAQLHADGIILKYKQVDILPVD